MKREVERIAAYTEMEDGTLTQEIRVDSRTIREQVTRCSDCKHARIETHKGDNELVCWHHHPGYVTQPDGFCHRAIRRDAYEPTPIH